MIFSEIVLSEIALLLAITLPAGIAYGLRFACFTRNTYFFYYTFSTLMLITLIPRHQRKPKLLSTILIFTSLITAFFHANHVVLLGILWMLSVMLFIRHSSGYQQYLRAQSTALILFAIAVSCVYLQQQSIFPTTRWTTVDLSTLSPNASLGIAALFLISGSLRQGLFPFHSALKDIVNRCAFPILLLTTSANMGLYIVIRFALPLIDQAPAWFHSGVMVWISLVFLALAVSVLTSNNLRKFYVCMMSIQSTLIFVGYLQADSLGEIGALLQWVVALLAGSGFGLCVWMFEIRTGVRRLTKSTVCFDKMPRLAILFLVFGMCIVDVPGTLGFVGEDLLIHAVLKKSILEGLTLLIAMACTSIAVYRCYVQLFLGRKLGSNELSADIVPREAYAFVAILTLLVGLGCYPKLITQMAGKTTFHEEQVRQTEPSDHLAYSEQT
ncbi:MAG: proton-conducting transporter membrane subunit [Gammaproteobacteria bacterium]